LESSRLQVTHSDFINRTIQIPEHIDPDSISKIIVLTSKTAVMAWIELAKYFMLELTQYSFYCIEFATQQEALKHGLSIKGTAKDASSLANEILIDSLIRKVTFICSNLRREQLSVKLKQGNVEVNEIIAYHTKLTPHKITSVYQAVLFFSTSTVDSFLLSNAINDTRAFCIGKTTAHHAMLAGFHKIDIATVSSVDELITVVVSYYSKN
jgi:uroporphyrinogen-III synthase